MKRLALVIIVLLTVSVQEVFCFNPVVDEICKKPGKSRKCFGLYSRGRHQRSLNFWDVIKGEYNNNTIHLYLTDRLEEEVVTLSIKTNDGMVIYEGVYNIAGQEVISVPTGELEDIDYNIELICGTKTYKGIF